MNIAEELLILISTYSGIMIIAFILQLLANFVIVFSLKNNIRQIREMLEEIYIPYKEKNDYDRRITEEERNRRNSIMEEIRKQEEKEKRKQAEEKAEQEIEEIKKILHTELDPKLTATAITIMIIGIIGIAIYFIFFS